MAERRRLGLAFALVIAALLSGCAGVPSSGPVHLGSSLPSVSGVDDRDVHAYPQGPVNGQSPVEMVTQFLDAMVDNDANYGVARRFLATGATWNSTTAPIHLYGQQSLSVGLVRNHVVRATVNQVGTIDSDGRYRIAPRQLTVSFRLVRERDEWRIARLANGVLLSTSDALRSLASANLYYFNLAENRLVPTPIVVPPDQPGLATILMRALLAGPSRALAPAVDSAAQTSLDLIGNVPIDRDGVAEVNLSNEVQQISAEALQRLSAQIVWTLRQVPTVTGVELFENGTPISVAGVPRVQSVALWRAFDPDAPPTRTGALIVRNGRVAGVGNQVPPVFSGTSFTAPIVSAGGSRVAALRAVGHRQELIDGAALGPLRTPLSAATLSSPSFDPAGNVYVVRGDGAGTDLVRVPTSGRSRVVALPRSIAAHGIGAIDISRDGARIAMVVGPRNHGSLVIGALSTDHGRPRVTGTTAIIPAGARVAGVSWVAGDKVVTTVSRGHVGRAVVRMSIDGYRPRVLTNDGLSAPPTQVAAAPGQPLLAAAGGAVWSYSGHSWSRVSTGADPSYAG